MPQNNGGCVEYSAQDVLVVDEIGYLSYSNRHADLLFELLNRRYEKTAALPALFPCILSPMHTDDNSL